MVFNITLLFAFVVLHFKYVFKLFFSNLSAFVIYDCMAAFCIVSVDELVVAGCSIP